MIFLSVRRWLPPVCLLAVIAAVWALPRPQHCAALAWDDDPSIAQVGGECVLLSDYASRLRIVEAGIEYAEREPLPDDPFLDNLRARHELVISYGPETVALADVIENSALYQRAVAEGHAPTDEEVSYYRDRDRLRSEGTRDFLELVKLVEKSDLDGIEELMERATHPDFKTMLKDVSLPELQESFGGPTGRELEEFLEESLEEGEAYLESVGRERYWNEIYSAELRRDLSVDNLEQAVIDLSIDGPWEIPGLAWLSYKEEALAGVSVELTGAAPAAASVDGALSYLSELREVSRRPLIEEYERRRKR